MSLQNCEALPEGCAGFTLLELLVVLSILAAVALTAFPRLGGTAEKVSLQSTALKLAADLRAVRTEAMRNNDEKTLTVDVTGRSYWSDERLHLQKIPKGIEVTLSGVGIDWVGDTTGRIHFQPEGSATEATISLKQDHRQAKISIDWLTGATHISWLPG